MGPDVPQAGAGQAYGAVVTVVIVLGLIAWRNRKPRPLPIPNNQFARAEVPADAQSVHITGDTDFALFYQLTEAGYDLTPPTTEIKNRIEVFRAIRVALA